MSLKFVMWELAHGQMEGIPVFGGSYKHVIIFEKLKQKKKKAFCGLNLVVLIKKYNCAGMLHKWFHIFQNLYLSKPKINQNLSDRSTCI